MLGWTDLGGLGLVRAALERHPQPHSFLPGADDALAALERELLSALIIEAPGIDAGVRRLLAAARASGTPVLLIARDARVATGVEALHLGASDYLAAPFDYDSFRRALERLQGAAGATDPEPEDASFVTLDPELQSTLALARSIAASDATVLIEGESGTGKEVLARLIHRVSPRGRRELVSVNCAALPPGLLESELFGHERGAFTGALARSIGKFELAHTSTILLDEIGELELTLQAKLLRVLQEKQVQRIGARRPVAVDFRLIATTNRDLREEVRRGRFREDLFYRLNVLPIRLKPLRERVGDALALLEHFLEGHARAGRTLPLLTAEARAALQAHAWPGNARELQNLVERLVLTHGGRRVGVAELGLEAASGAPSGATPRPAAAPAGIPFRTLREMERWLIVETLKRMEGNRTRAARELDIGLRTLRNKIREYGVYDPETLPRSGAAPRAGQNPPGGA
jgi:two-component system response regulator FlrC